MQQSLQRTTNQNVTLDPIGFQPYDLTLSSPSPRLYKPDKASSYILNHKPLHAARFGHPVHPLPPSFTFRLSDALRKFSTYLGFADFYACPFF